MPLYVSRAFAVVMYIFGFRAGYLWAADAWGASEPSPLVIDLAIFAVIFAITMISTALAFLDGLRGLLPRLHRHHGRAEHVRGPRDAGYLWPIRDRTSSPCLFTQDSGGESALA